ncbi:hypothetical protein N6H14_16330 [Paenibacillus sp. CC-CFT747]|nr:hypothetical protein N6H14_16330 [Paenibacillus sp. CC-CFT747]
MNKKKWIASILASTMVFGVTSTSFAASNNSQSQQQTKTIHNEKSLISNGENLGKLTQDTTITISKKGSDTLFTVTENNDYELAPSFKSIPEYQNRFADNSQTKNYRITSDKKLYLNGELLDVGHNANEQGLMTISNATGEYPNIVTITAQVIIQALPLQLIVMLITPVQMNMII